MKNKYFLQLFTTANNAVCKCLYIDACNKFNCIDFIYEFSITYIFFAISHMFAALLYYNDLAKL